MRVKGDNKIQRKKFVVYFLIEWIVVKSEEYMGAMQNKFSAKCVEKGDPELYNINGLRGVDDRIALPVKRSMSDCHHYGYLWDPIEALHGVAPHPTSRRV